MKNLLLGCTIALLLFAQSAYAGEIAVLLPVTGPLTPFEKNELSKELVQGFAASFELKYGEEVERYVRKVFQEESKKQDCDETNCYRRIAAQYHAEKIIALHVAAIEQGRYLVTAHLYDVLTGGMTSSQKEECAQCSFEKLKVLCQEITRRMSKAQ